jgi:dienelactone hydrolase
MSDLLTQPHSKGDAMKRFQFLVMAVALSLALANECRAQEAPRIRDVVYGRKYGMALTMDVVKPAKPSGVGLLVMVSGGFTSDIAYVDSVFKLDTFKPFLDKGYTLFFVCHGSQPKFTVVEIVSDVHRAVRFIRTNAKTWGVDPERLCVTGASSGGHLSLSLGAGGKPGNKDAKDPVEQASSRVQAVACFFPPTDFVDYGTTGRTFLEFERARAFRNIFGVQDKSREEQIKMLKSVSPLHAITKDAAPTLIIHGDADDLVPPEQSERFTAKLKENNVPCELILRPKGGHGWSDMAKDYTLFADWFEKQLPAK